MNEIADTVMLTTKCSGGCGHCPFSNPDLEKLFLTRFAVQKIISQLPGRLAVLSGGEPFEHPEISEILTDLGKQTTPFRIATGGFIDLAPWIDQLKALTCSRRSLQGISMGTDVLSARVNHSRWAPIWKNNIRLLMKFQIPYSLTLSIGTDLAFTHLNLWEWTTLFDNTPEFIFLRYSDTDLLRKWMQKIQNHFEGVPIIQDDVRPLTLEKKRELEEAYRAAAHDKGRSWRN